MGATPRFAWRGSSISAALLSRNLPLYMPRLFDPSMNGAAFAPPEFLFLC
jgi:hypothetical protein